MVISHGAKFEVTSLFINFKQFIETQLSTKIKCIRIEYGTRYINHSPILSSKTWHSQSNKLLIHPKAK
ncbi:hypothetical protein KFK09_007612 [Dendrobium nobile]|uniref:Uncharacterized protein n=1 Tax=Dendrobium nobile TaxID=94219 RepID=A0A8T3BX10_DENNO|nr:hypothetical protein KFK09_007612 [Dendrobium nobile]